MVEEQNCIYSKELAWRWRFIFFCLQLANSCMVGVVSLKHNHSRDHSARKSEWNGGVCSFMVLL